jgi:hypothetical protein
MASSKAGLPMALSTAAACIVYEVLLQGAWSAALMNGHLRMTSMQPSQDVYNAGWGLSTNKKPYQAKFQIRSHMRLLYRSSELYIIQPTQ